MTREEFLEFTRSILEDAVELAERETGLTLSRELCFRWFHQESAPICSNVAEVLVDRVYVGPDLIYPCVDLGVGDVLDDGRTLIEANVAGYGPRPFGPNWTGREGPYVLIYGAKLAKKARLQD